MALVDLEAWYAANRLDTARGVATYTEVTDPAVLAVLDILAPRDPRRPGERIPVFEFGHETTPTRIEMVELAQAIVDAVAAAVRAPR
jgi:hypothetical protein